MSATTPAAGEGPAVTYERDGRVATISLDRPAIRNALSTEVGDALGDALDRFAEDREAHVAILRGNGPSFCAGFDLRRGSASTAPTEADPWGDRRRLRGWVDLALRLWESPRPIVAQVHGHCLGGGILLALCSDLVVASETCVLGWPRLPMGAGFLDGALAHVVGQRRAKQLSYEVGSRITGAQAAEWGLANAAVPEADLEREAEALARRIARAPANVLEIRKAAITRASSGLSFRDALLAGVEWDAIAHVDVEVTAVRGLVREHGMAAVIEAFETTDDPFAALADGAPRPGDATG